MGAPLETQPLLPPRVNSLEQRAADKQGSKASVASDDMSFSQYHGAGSSASSAADMHTAEESVVRAMNAAAADVVTQDAAAAPPETQRQIASQSGYTPQLVGSNSATAEVQD